MKDYATTAGRIERLELATGFYLTDADINRVIQDMTAFATSPRHAAGRY